MHLIYPPVPVWAERDGASRYLWDLDAEANVPTWFASAQLAVLGALLLLLAMAIRGDRRRESIALAAAGALAAALSLDELMASTRSSARARGADRRAGLDDHST